MRVAAQHSDLKAGAVLAALTLGLGLVVAFFAGPSYVESPTVIRVMAHVLLPGFAVDVLVSGNAHAGILAWYDWAIMLIVSCSTWAIVGVVGARVARFVLNLRRRIHERTERDRGERAT